MALTESGVFWLQGSELVSKCAKDEEETRRQGNKEGGRQGRRSDVWERTEGKARQAKKGRTGERFRHHRAFAHSHPILPFSLLEPTWRKQSLFVGQLRACGWRSVCASLASDHGEAPSRGDRFVCPQWTEPSVHFSGISLVRKERREGGRDGEERGTRRERERGDIPNPSLACVLLIPLT